MPSDRRDVLPRVAGAMIVLASIMVAASGASRGVDGLKTEALATPTFSPTAVSAAPTPRPIARSATRPALAHRSAVPLAIIGSVRAASGLPPAPISPPLLARLVRACSTEVSVGTQAAVVAVESDGNAWALHDDNSKREYRPHSFNDAVTLASYLINSNRQRYGKNDAGVDVGVSQINSNNFRSLGVDVAWMLHPCPNLRVSSRMLAKAYRLEYAALADVDEPQRSQVAADRALQIYQSGNGYGDEKYVRQVRSALNRSWVRRVMALAGDDLLSNQVSAANGQGDGTATTAEFSAATNGQSRSLSSSEFYHEDVTPVAPQRSAQPTPTPGPHFVPVPVNALPVDNAKP